MFMYDLIYSLYLLAGLMDLPEAYVQVPGHERQGVLGYDCRLFRIGKGIGHGGSRMIGLREEQEQGTEDSGGDTAYPIERT